MRWRLWRKASGNGELREARQIREQKEDELQQAERQWPEVRATAAEIRHHREQNRFSERIMRAVRGT